MLLLGEAGRVRQGFEWPLRRELVARAQAAARVPVPPGILIRPRGKDLEGCPTVSVAAHDRLSQARLVVADDQGFAEHDVFESLRDAKRELAGRQRHLDEGCPRQDQTAAHAMVA